MEFDPEKWDQIVKQWDAEDTSSAADDLESGKDAMDLADPKTWAEHDAMAKGAGQLVGEAQATDQDARKNGIGQLAAQALQAPTRIRAPIQPDSQPATAGAGEKGNAGLPVSAAEPAASPPPPPESLDWKGLGQRLKNAELSRGLSQGAESMFANIGAQSGYKPNQHAGDAGVDMVRGELDLAKAKQGQESHDASMAANKAALGVKHAMDDPNSLQSQKARSAIESMGVPLPKGFDAYSANDIHNFVKTGELVRIQSDQANERDRVAKAGATEAQKAGALADRKRTMLSLYPDHANEINSLADLGDAQTLQTALEGRAGREATQAHSDVAAGVADKRSLEREIALRKWEAEHPKPQPMSAEQHTQLEALNKSEGVINEFEKSLSKVQTPTQKAAASFPKAGGAIGAAGSEFPSARTMAATQLARGLEGGTAKPGNVEMIDQILPTHMDSPEIRAKKLEALRAQMKANREGFNKAMEQSGQKAPTSGGLKTRKTKDGGTAYSKTGEPGSWYTTEKEATEH